VLNPADVARLAIATQEAEPRRLVSEFEVDGAVDPDEARLVAVPSRVAGRIEKMFVNVTGQNVNRGEPLYSIYSPSLVVSQEEYLLALNNRQRLQSSPYAQVQENAVQLVEASRKRLDFAGLTEAQIRLLEQTGHTQDEVTFQATMAGTVMKKHVVEGNYVEQGDPIYTLADLSKVWMVARVPEHEISWVTRGQKVRITIVSIPGEIFSGEVTFIDPVVDPETRTVKVRAEIANSHRKLKPGMFGRVKIRSSSLKPFLSIPSSAVIDATPLPLVYVDKGNGLFVARPVRVGQVTTEYIAVLDGLEEGERVVVHGNFFIDSQRQLHRGSGVLWGNSKEIEAKEPTRPQAP
jgi:membrane fusion protein, copper/silver efflux system